MDNRFIVRTAYFTDHVTGKTAIAVEVDSKEFDGTQSVSNIDKATYGEMWLNTILKILRNAIYKHFSGNADIVLVTSQKQCHTLATKVIKLYIKLLASKKQDEKKIVSLVAAANHYHNNPTDVIYVEILKTLLDCKHKFKHFNIDAQRVATPATNRVFNLAKDMVAPNYVIPKKPRVKKTADNKK